MLNFRIAAQLPHHAAVAAADDQHVLHIGMDGHGDVYHHLVVDELILLCEHHISVQGEEAAELLGVEHVNPLELALATVQLLVHPDGQLYIGGVGFTKPKLHTVSPPLSPKHSGR